MKVAQGQPVVKLGGEEGAGGATLLLCLQVSEVFQKERTLPFLSQGKGSYILDSTKATRDELLSSALLQGARTWVGFKLSSDTAPLYPHPMLPQKCSRPGLMGL